MSWTNKAVWAWGWVLTPEEIATLPDEIYEEWCDNEWLISSEASDEIIFFFFSFDADESPKNVTDLLSEADEEESAKRIEAFHKAFPARTDESQAYLWYVLC